MAFSISQMLSAVNSVGGLSKASKFMVTITRSAGSSRDDRAPPIAGGAQNLTFLCDSAYLPGLGYQTDEIRMSGYGNVEKRPYATIFQDVPLTFYSDADGSVFKYFHAWMQSVFAFNDAANPNGTVKGLPLNSFQYPSEYYGVVEIIHMNEIKTTKESDNTIVKYQLLEAYPISIGDIQVDWNMQDQILKIPVTFAYTNWTSTTLDQGVADRNSLTRTTALTGRSNFIDEQLNKITEKLIYKGSRIRDGINF
jgi:hypothetical protein